MHGNTDIAASFDLVIFDCDGVLVDSEVISCGLVAEMMRQFGADHDLLQALRRYLGRPSTVVTDDYVQLSGQPLPADFVKEWRSQLFDEFDAKLESIPGVRAAVEALPVPYCVASSSDEERIEFCLRATRLWPLFEGRIFSTTMVANGKPAPDLFLLAASQMGAAPHRCLVIEDSVSGIKAGKAAGMVTWGFSGGSHYAVLDQTEDLIAAGADRVMNRMSELRLAVKA